MADPTPKIALALAILSIYYLITAVILFFMTPRSKHEQSAFNDFIDSCILVISIFPSFWLLLKTFSIL